MLNSGHNSSEANLFILNIYEKHGSLICKVINSYLKDKNRADDVFQNFFVHLITNPIPADVEHIDGYLYRVLINCIMENMQQTASYQKSMTRYAENTTRFEVQEDPADIVIEADQIAKRNVLIHTLLSHKEHLAITLHYRDNRTIREIAKVMDIKITSVKRCITRALNKLRDSALSGEIPAAGA